MTQGPWYRRLSVQLVALLTLALLPLGSVALFQTHRVAVEAERTASTALLGLTERAARNEQTLIERAVGAARLFGSVAPDLLDNPDACFANLSRFVGANAEFSFIGILPLSGIVACSSSPEVLDFRDAPGFADAMAAAQPTIIATEAGAASGQSVFVVSEPFYVEDDFAGFVSVSIPHSGLPGFTEAMEDLGLVELMTFNDEGAVLTSRSDFDVSLRELPSGIQLAGLSVDDPQTFRAFNRDGIERRYSIVTIAGSPAAVMAVWQLDDGAVMPDGVGISPVIFPVLMWLASMGVAMLAMHTLVLRHLRRIRGRMNAFADTRQTGEAFPEPRVVPVEIELVEQNFERMSQEVLQDEAALEDALREKGVLVKEIHHRVKNNLQLISSIINMQIRSAELEETQTVLRRVQERVLSLATIHRDLYQSEENGRVNTGALVTEIVDNSVELVRSEGSDLTVNKDIENLLLYPDQAVPLSLLVSEATTNALKHIGDRPGETSYVDVSLRQDGTSCVFVLANSIGQTTVSDSTGLGSKLMTAFATQLGGKIDVEQSEDRYMLTVSFEALEFEPEARDF